jgi:hypothetical protein
VTTSGLGVVRARAFVLALVGVCLATAAVSAGQPAPLLNCLCSCAIDPGQRFCGVAQACFYQPGPFGSSPSCLNLDNGECVNTPDGGATCGRTQLENADLPIAATCAQFCRNTFGGTATPTRAQATATRTSSPPRTATRTPTRTRTAAATATRTPTRGSGGDCCVEGEAAGCDSAECEACVCADDDFCCVEVWDDLCAEAALGECAEECACGDAPTPTRTPTRTRTGAATATRTPTRGGGGGCCVEGEAAGCDSAECEACVCADDDFCCVEVWDDLCAEAAVEDCPSACGCGDAATATPTASRTRTFTATVMPTAVPPSLTPTRAVPPTSTRSPSRTRTATRTPTPTPGVDLIADSIEVSQAVQDLNNSVRLVADRRTFVRFHVHAARGIHRTGARLRAERGASMVTLQPLNPGGEIAVRVGPNRAMANHAFLFELPDGFRSANVRLTAELNPDQSPPESSRANNTLTVDPFFEAVPEPFVVVYRIGYTDGIARYPTNADVRRLVGWLRRAYPVSGVRGTRRSHLLGPGLPTCDQVNNFLLCKSVWDTLHSDDVPLEARYYGMVDDGGGFMRGCAAAIPTSVASGPSGPTTTRYRWDTDGNYGDWYGGHELGHAFGRQHAEFCNARDGADYPHPSGRISPEMMGPTALYGFDIATREIYGPNWHDVMTYCDYQWISDFTYEGLMDFFQSDSIDFGAGGGAVDRLLVVGSIRPGSGDIFLEPLFIIPAAEDVIERVPGDYAILLRDSVGAVLARYPFTPRPGHPGPAQGPSPGEERDVEVLFINELVPYVDGATRVDVEGPDGLLYTVVAGLASPTVTLTTPNGGEILAGETIPLAWSAGDPDDDDLRFNLQYSADDGATWEMVAQGLSGTSFDLDASNVRNSEQARFRVWASDGIHTAVDQSDASFRVSNRVPAVFITEPPDGAVIAAGQTATFVGDAFDSDLGIMDDAQLGWSSSRDGPLGSGALLSVANLSLGTHTIALRADDGEGGVATVAVEVTVVSDPREVPPPPDRLIGGPAPITFDTAAGAVTVMLAIENANDGAPLDWTAVESQPWIRLSQTTGVTPAAVTVRFANTGLTSGAYGATITLSSTATSNAVVVPVEARVGRCMGDCNSDGVVTIEELVAGVGAILVRRVALQCQAFDRDDDGAVSVDELLTGIHAALNGCGAVPAGTDDEAAR